MIVPFVLGIAAAVALLWDSDDDEKKKPGNPEPENKPLTKTEQKLADTFIAQEIKAFEEEGRWESLEQAKAVGISRARKRAKELKGGKKK